MENQYSRLIYFAPLQEATDFVYRRAHARFFGGIDQYFAPYLLRQNDGTIKKSQLRDIDPKNNPDYPLVTQIMAGTADKFLFLARQLEAFGYHDINWNLGCPYPMVTNRGQGSGLLPHPDRIKEILETVVPKLRSRISIKMRAGLYSPDEIYPIIPILNDFPLSEIIIHPRVGKQLYKGMADRTLFASIGSEIKHPLVYNGDIETPEDFELCRTMFPETTRWMIGRGILKDPLLPLKIRGTLQWNREERIESLRQFHDEVLGQYAVLLSGNSHLLMRMLKFWSYFSHLFPQPHKALKRVKKAVNRMKYDIAVSENFQMLYHEEN